MKIVAISDTHMLHDQIVMPEGDVLIHAGDATWLGQKSEFQTFVNWLADLPYARKIYVAGNHDTCLDRSNDRGWAQAILANAGIDYLRDSGVEIDGVRFYGSPWVVPFGNWGFMRPDDYRYSKFRMIPADTDVLITHGPPYGVAGLDLSGYTNTLEGDKVLGGELTRLIDGGLQAHVFGHFHRGYGRAERGGITFANVAICDEMYNAVHKPTVIEITAKPIDKPAETGVTSI